MAISRRLTHPLLGATFVATGIEALRNPHEVEVGHDLDPDHDSQDVDLGTGNADPGAVSETPGPSMRCRSRTAVCRGGHRVAPLRRHPAR